MSTSMPDVNFQEKSTISDTLDWVGMRQIALPLQLQAGQHQCASIQATASPYVNLIQPAAKGIHMSRIYLSLNGVVESTLTPKSLKSLLSDYLSTHQGLSDAAKLELDFELMLKRTALISDNFGWKSYPCKITMIQNQSATKLELQVKVPYSSTCPCSAALARQLIQKQFLQDFDSTQPIDHEKLHQWLGSTQGIVATPHSQRSEALINFSVDSEMAYFPFQFAIDLAEEVLSTPVQTAVKREDEQEFARLNGQNLMFVEDAARKLKQAFYAESMLLDFNIQVTHFESLHAHDAVAMVSKQS
jgi:GTP cyclohydrolase I